MYLFHTDHEKLTNTIIHAIIILLAFVMTDITMTTTENLQKHIDDLENKRLDLFFHMQNTAGNLTGRLYNFNMIIGIAGIAIFLMNRLLTAQYSAYFITWSNILAITACIFAFFQYLYLLDKISARLYKNICSIYKTYDDEYFILKKYTEGSLDEQLIRQFYITKNAELERYTCTAATPNLISWIATSFVFASLLLSLLA